MSLALHHECIRVPVTALAFASPFLVVAEGPFVRFYNCQNFELVGTKRIFEDQAIHGIAVDATCTDHVRCAVWGGSFVRILAINHAFDIAAPVLDALRLSSVLRAPDWILDLSFSPSGSQKHPEGNAVVCAAVTAHNALIELRVPNPLASDQPNQACLADLTSGSRSILYSAHLLWDSFDHMLVAAGTAFGEIIYWSWRRNAPASVRSRILKVFLGHEGSIFGVRISASLESATGKAEQRLLASCSDDRTIRIWDVTGLASRDQATTQEDATDAHRIRHTGFSNASFDADTSTSDILAIGWGHVSRIWSAQFLDYDVTGSMVSLLSSGEDATSRVWRLGLVSQGSQSTSSTVPCNLTQVSSDACHSGKNIWSTTIFLTGPGTSKVVCGGADSKIAARSLPGSSQTTTGSLSIAISEYTLEDIAAMGDQTSPAIPQQPIGSHKSSKMAEFFRSYSFLDASSFLLTTNSGKILMENLHAETGAFKQSAISDSNTIDQVEELAGYSICVSDSLLGIALVAGSRGNIHTYRKGTPSFPKLCTLEGKIGNIFTARVLDTSSCQTLIVLVTLMGQKAARLFYLDVSNVLEPTMSNIVEIPLFEILTGSTITSMAYMSATSGEAYIAIGFRGGSIATYSLMNTSAACKDTKEAKASLFRIIERAHGKEAVTSMHWVASSGSITGHLVSVGRDGCCAVHYMNLANNYVELVHCLFLPVGPNIEGNYLQDNHLMVYGFSGTNFVVYDTTAEEEIMNVETGGSHRSWTFQPKVSEEGGGILVWTRASSMHICRQNGPNHTVIRPGGHGREIKSVAVSPTGTNTDGRQLIATGAEDTDIKLFRYVDGNFVCKRTLRKHTTGIQCLQWSEDGSYLFTSGGCEEFYIWRIRDLPSPLGIGVVCESVCVPETERSDLRIMSFDVRRRRRGEYGYVIAMVYSDSTMRISSYDPTAAVKWHTLAKGTYFTSCLTQCIFLSPCTILTAGTDGHAVLWPLPAELNRPHATTPSPPVTLDWRYPARIHQNTSKTLDSHTVNSGRTLLVSGGDDGSLAFVSSLGSEFEHPPIIVVRAHASAITACSIIPHQGKVYVLSSGNDQWVRLWQVTLHVSNAAPQAAALTSAEAQDPLTIKRIKKIKTNVADMSSMAILSQNEEVTKVILCGVGMEVIKIDWNVA